MRLHPVPFTTLVRRMFRELEQRSSIFDLAARRFVTRDPTHDLSVPFHQEHPSTPFGPAAGPHTQLAQNIVLSWLAGGRVIELKTVQVRDDLEIPRPCIDVQTVGYNVEWSQELRLEESIEEYVKAALLIRLLAASGRLDVAGFDDTVFDISVGYDLAGLTSPRVQAFLNATAAIRPIVDRLRREIPLEYANLRDVPMPRRLASSVTVSTFHGCPSGQIAGMVDHLMSVHGLDAIVKLNPMLLGAVETRRLLNDALGYRDIRVPDKAFASELTWPEMLDLVGRLRARADALGRSLGVKLTNTLVVENHRTFFPASEREMYLSGAPLHVLAIELLRRVRGALGPEIPVSFSAGIDATNFADAVALGLVPVTACTDLLRNGGYGRPFAYFQRLARRMDDVGARSIGEWIVTAMGSGAPALEHLRLDADTRGRCLTALEHRGDLRAAIADDERWCAWQHAAAMLNTTTYATRVVDDPRYAETAHRKGPRKVGSRLHLFDCLTCDICVPVCPNDANFPFTLPVSEWRKTTASFDGVGWRVAFAGAVRATEAHQLGNVADLCNDCGNCDVFCPEDGGPYKMKPRFFRSEAAYHEAGAGDGVFVGRQPGVVRVLGRMDGIEVSAELVPGAPATLRLRGDGFDLTFDEHEPESTIAGTATPGVDVDLTSAFVVLALARGVTLPDAVNYLNVN